MKEGLKSLMDHETIFYLWCHRSHVNYLLLYIKSYNEFISNFNNEGKIQIKLIKKVSNKNGNKNSDAIKL